MRFELAIHQQRNVNVPCITLGFELDIPKQDITKDNQEEVHLYLYLCLKCTLIRQHVN